ncbi:MAG: bacterioferritin [Steroidobacterales bacterium]
MSAHPAHPENDQNHGFLSNVADIRRRARRHIQQRTVSADPPADRDLVLRLLNAALATELACVQRYRGYAVLDRDAVSDALRSDFMKHAQEEQAHADRIAARIVELGGQPHLAPNPASARGSDGYGEDENLTDMLAEDLIAERIAIDTCREIIGFLGDQDPPTRQLFESILAAEQDHAGGLASLRETMRHLQRGAPGSNHISPRAEEGLVS